MEVLSMLKEMQEEKAKGLLDRLAGSGVSVAMENGSLKVTGELHPADRAALKNLKQIILTMLEPEPPTYDAPFKPEEMTIWLSLFGKGEPGWFLAPLVQGYGNMMQTEHQAAVLDYASQAWKRTVEQLGGLQWYQAHEWIDVKAKLEARLSALSNSSTAPVSA